MLTEHNDITLNRAEIDRTFANTRNEKLNCLDEWLMTGAIDPQQALSTIEKYYLQMPF